MWSQFLCSVPVNEVLRRVPGITGALSGGTCGRSRPAGAHQIDDVQARSWIETGNLFATGTPRSRRSCMTG
jgi:hypothetical protein